MSTRKVLITGVYGLIGSGVYERHSALPDAYEVHGLARRRDPSDRVAAEKRIEIPDERFTLSDQSDLAVRQAEIIADIFRWSGGSRILVCPTYYSFDPVLEKHFGAMPGNYWQTLGRELPREVDILWTGNRVCSDTVTVADIELINALVGRPVMLWDNYPVNDGAVRSKFLYCDKAAGREPGLDGVLSGHLSNPMNQALLSLPALAGLSALYGFRDYDEDWLSRVLGVQTWEQLRRDRGQFRDSGLEGMDARERELLAQRYAGLPGQAAQEVAGWLLGQYTFDPACLTD